MTDENLNFIQNLKINDVPWHRLTTALSRGTEFPLCFKTLSKQCNLSDTKKALTKLKSHVEHQSTLWHASPFAMIFLCRILVSALQNSEQNQVAKFLATELLNFVTRVVVCYQDISKTEHAVALPLFADLLKEEFLWSQEYNEEEDFMRYEEEGPDVFPANLFYSFYFYSWETVNAYRSSLEESMPKSLVSQAQQLWAVL